jgi:hypothetical protein
MSILFTFPGQGAQRAGMLHALPQNMHVQHTLAEAAIRWVVTYCHSIVPMPYVLRLRFSSPCSSPPSQWPDS